MVGKLIRVPLTEVWKHEAINFTPWLQDNLDVLNEVLAMTVSNAEREQAAGAFSIDLVAEDESGNPVIIENQLYKSDHDHLGKIITYLTAIEARTAIWIVSEPRPEHVKAVSWLNESSSANFYLVKAEAVRIGDSPPAPLFTVIVMPSADARVVGKTKKELAERHVTRRHFWTELLANAKHKTKLHSAIKPSTDGWISTSAGRSGFSLIYVIRMNDSRVELYIDCGDREKNKSYFSQLHDHKDEIEKSFGNALNWDRLEAKRACCIRKVLDGKGLNDKEHWLEIQDRMIDAMIRLDHAMRPHIQQCS
jgi:hypothetical protein